MSGLDERFCCCCGAGGAQVFLLRDGRRWSSCPSCSLGCGHCGGIMVGAVLEAEAHAGPDGVRAQSLKAGLLGAGEGRHSEAERAILDLLMNAGQPVPLPEVMGAFSSRQRYELSPAIGSLVFWGDAVVDRRWETLSLPNRNELGSGRQACCGVGA